MSYILLDFSKPYSEILLSVESYKNEEFFFKLYTFISHWFLTDENISVQTSGSTGIFKTLIFTREQMLASATRTNEYFQLNKDSKALLAMDIKYIGAKMMIVRSIAAKMKLYVIAPCSDPLENELFEDKSIQIDFIPVVPLQMYHMCSHSEKLSHIKTIIIGGGSLDHKLVKTINQLGIETKCYETFGMTETISHIAVRRVGEMDFEVLDEVKIDVDHRNTLCVFDQKTMKNPIQTNDIVEIIDQRKFRWIGRFDNVINSGGMKFYPEELEKKINHLIKNPFVIVGVDDEVLGQKTVLIQEGEVENEDNILVLLCSILSKYELPKSVIGHKYNFERVNDKIDRNAAKKLAEDYLNITYRNEKIDIHTL
jgi:o-succinylbenzoate---CoA ligase